MFHLTQFIKSEKFNKKAIENIFLMILYIFVIAYYEIQKKKILSVIDFECKWYVNSTTGNYASLTLIVALK